MAVFLLKSQGRICFFSHSSLHSGHLHFEAEASPFSPKQAVQHFPLAYSSASRGALWLPQSHLDDLGSSSALKLVDYQPYSTCYPNSFCCKIAYLKALGGGYGHLWELFNTPTTKSTPKLYYYVALKSPYIKETQNLSQPLEFIQNYMQIHFFIQNI